MEINNFILSYNLNAWMPVNTKLTMEDKIVKLKSYIYGTYGLPAVIMLQEVMAGRGREFLNAIELNFSNYEVITPASFDYRKHSRSIMCVTLIRRDILGSYTTKVLDSELPNRINYVIANIAGNEVRFLNTHIVQTACLKNQAKWYIQDRFIKKARMWDLLHDEAEAYKDYCVVIGGDLQENKFARNVIKLSKLGYKLAGTRQATVMNDVLAEDRIDHILFSESAYELFKPVGVMVDTSEVGNLSDHALVYAACLA